jgi:hypothetical protein
MLQLLHGRLAAQLYRLLKAFQLSLGKAQAGLHIIDAVL